MSSRVKLFAIDKQTGKRAWAHDMVKEFGAEQDDRGYSPSPIAYRDTVIVLAGGPRPRSSRSTRRPAPSRGRAASFPVRPGSPILINVDGQDQLVVLGANEVVGVDPPNGTVLWTSSAQDGMGPEHQHAGLGRRQPAVRVVRLQQRRARR